MLKIIIISLLLSGCLKPKHEDTLCRHNQRFVAIDSLGMNGDEMLAASTQAMTSACGGPQIEVVETSSTLTQSMFIFKCMNVCDGQEQAPVQMPGGSQ